MFTGLVEIHYFPNSLIIKKELLDFIFRLHRRFPDCSRSIMENGWRSPIGDWAKGSTLCLNLFALKKYLAEILEPDEWDFFTWFEILEIGGTMKPHNFIEHSFTAHYLVEGRAEMIVEQGKKGAWVDMIPGQMIIFSSFAKISIPKPISQRTISVVLNGNRTVGL